MKGLKIIFLLAIFNVLGLMSNELRAQDENAAFYIYQNDGHFDGFFYDEVMKMSYSKTDTAGVEYDVFVSQEIVTADSTYRIMLSAIDSVSFVQPEMEYRPNVHNIREDGLVNYINRHNQNEMWISFKNDLPADKLPQVGDILVDFDNYNGFSCKITNVEAWQNVVYYEPIKSVKDVFQRFVCVEQMHYDQNGNMVRRRVAGMPELAYEEGPSRKLASSNFDFRLLNMDFGGHIPIISTDDLTMSFDINTHVAMTLKGSYNINLIEPIYIGLTFTSDLSFGLGVTLDGKLKTIIDKSSDYIPGIPVPAAAPIFELRNIPGLFARGDAHLKFSAGLVNLAGAKVWHKLVFNDDWVPTLTFGHLKGEAEAEQPDANHIDQYVEFNGFVQAGLHAPLTLSTNRWLSKFCKAEFGTHLYIGPKLSGAVQLNFVDLMRNGASVFNGLKNTALTLTPLSVDFETKATASGLLWGESEFTFGDGAVSVLNDYSLYLLPDFEDWKEEKNPHDSLGNVVEGQYVGLICKDRATLFPYQVGIRIFRKEDNEYEHIGDIWDGGWGNPVEWHYGDKWLKSKEVLDHPHWNVKLLASAGELRLRPVFKYGDMVFEGSPDYYCWGGLYFVPAKTTLSIGNEIGSEVSVGIETNMDYLYSASDLTLGRYNARYSKISEDSGVLYITTAIPNPDPFRGLVGSYDFLSLYNTTISRPLTISQPPTTAPKITVFSVAGCDEKGEKDYIHGCGVGEGDIERPISTNGGSFSCSYTKKNDDYGGTYSCNISATLTPDEEKGWGYFHISGSFSSTDIKKGKNEKNETYVTAHETQSGTFSGNIELRNHDVTGAQIGNQYLHNKCSVNVTRTATYYWRAKNDKDEYVTKSTTQTTTCNEGDISLSFGYSDTF